MFSGIVEAKGKLVTLEKRKGESRLEIQSDLFSREDERSRVGDSIAVSGVCLTLTAITGDHGVFDLSTETRKRTTLGVLNDGAEVNLERAVQVGAGLHGHFVLGHVDGVVSVFAREEKENTIRFSLTSLPELQPFIAEKGSIALDGVSLTVSDLERECFSVYVIPHTLSATTLALWKLGDRINVEVDVIARYLYQLMQTR